MADEGYVEGSAMETESESAPDAASVLPAAQPKRHFHCCRALGNGRYGTVYKARDNKYPGTHVALKIVRFAKSEDGVNVPILREVALLQRLEKIQHPNIVRFLDVRQGSMTDGDTASMLLVFELMDTDLAKFIARSSPFGISPGKMKDIMFQILCGVDFLHSQIIVHRDLKPGNVLLSESGRVKIADFGLSKILNSPSKFTPGVVTLSYRPPEVLLGLDYGPSVDIWSVGCIFAEMVLGRTFLPSNGETEQLERIFDLLGTPTEENWPEESDILSSSFRPRPPKDLGALLPHLDPVGLNLLKRILIFQPNYRIDAYEALRDPYFENRKIPEIVVAPKPATGTGPPIAVPGTSTASAMTPASAAGYLCATYGAAVSSPSSSSGSSSTSGYSSSNQEEDIETMQ